MKRVHCGPVLARSNKGYRPVSSLQIRRVPFADNLLQRLADDLLADLPGARDGDLSAALVLLPSARACKTLGRILLEQSGQDTLLLPRILTAEQWTGEAALGLGLSSLGLPDDRVRPILLARGLRDVSWLAGRQENAPALAREFLDFFDEVRRHRQGESLLQGQSLDAVLALAQPAEAEIIAEDLDKARQAWKIYRDAAPRDRTDAQVETADILAARMASGDGPPGRRYEQVIAAGFGRVDPVRADLLRAALAGGRQAWLVLPQSESRLSQLLLATWAPVTAEGAISSDPLESSRRIERLLTGEFGGKMEPESSGAIATTLRERLAAVGPVDDLAGPSGPLELLPCSDPEAESRLVADRVVSLLADQLGAPPRIGIAVNDPDLAARIYTQLTDAGLDLDNTHGQPLAIQPAGLLLRFILRAAMTELRAESLLEVLTHPYVKLTTGEAGHGHWTLQLEQIFRRDTGPEGGLSGLYRKAQDRDRAALDLFGRQGPGLVAFVTAVADAFAPLRDLRMSGQASWQELLDALTATWNFLAAEYPLQPDSRRHDIQAAAELVRDLRRESDRLSPPTLTEFSADLGRLLAEESVPPHRSTSLPVLLTGLVEARLERFDHLILAGMREGVFPKKTQRPLLLPGRIRRRLDLPGWHDALGRDAELFLRLLHNAPHVLLTWPVEEGGQPVLPSPFVSRLLLGLGDPGEVSTAETVWRKRAIPWPGIIAGEESFAAETCDPPAHESARPLTDLSWSALRVWRDCPYRFRLERGFVLRKPEEVRAEFSRMEYGRLVHEILRSWLAVDGAGYAALAAADRQQADALLRQEAAAKLLPGSKELPVRKLWLDSFGQIVPQLVEWELNRFPQWRPLALETKFRLPLTGFLDWARALGDELGQAPDLPANDELPDYASELHLVGAIDRVDRSQDGTGALAVIDYKTGRLPAAKAVQELEELQVLLYAAAIEAGALPASGGGIVTGLVRQGLYCSLAPDKAGAAVKPHLDATDMEGRRLLLDGAVELARLSLAAANPDGPFPLIPAERRGEGAAQLPCRYCDFRGLCRLEERSCLNPATRRKLDKWVDSREGFMS
jgi:ATP-dependent helicase/nuclease subunit B